MKPIAFLVLIGSLILLAIGYCYTRLQSDLTEARKEITETNRDNQNLRTKLASEDADLEALRKQNADLEQKLKSLTNQVQTDVKNQSSELQSLEAALAAQRQLTDKKRQTYQSMLNAKPGANDQAAIRKNLTDEMATLRQRINAIKEDINRTRDDGTQARDAHRSDSQFASAQEKSRVDSANQQLGALKKQRALIAGQKNNPVRSEQLQELDGQIAGAQDALNHLHGEQNSQRDQERVDRAALEAQIRQSLAELNDQQHKLESQLATKQTQLTKLDGATAASGQYQKEKADLIQKLAAELKEETDKLQSLEAQVAAARARTH